MFHLSILWKKFFILFKYPAYATLKFQNWNRQTRKVDHKKTKAKQKNLKSWFLFEMLNSSKKNNFGRKVWSNHKVIFLYFLKIQAWKTFDSKFVVFVTVVGFPGIPNLFPSEVRKTRLTIYWPIDFKIFIVYLRCSSKLQTNQCVL